MLYRFIVAGIILFWAVMTAYFLRMELSSGDSAAMAVPPSHVLKQMLLHEQSSDLVLYHQGQRLGNFHFQPKRIPATPDGATNALSGNGGFSLNLPGTPGQRLIISVKVEMDDQQTVKYFSAGGSIHEPRQAQASSGLKLEGWPARNAYHYQLRRGEEIVKNANGSPSALLDDPDLRAMGFDPRVLLSQAAQQQASSTKITVRRSSLRAGGETIETYLVTVHHAESLETTIHVSQLGQVLQVKTFLGYDLYDDALAP